MRPGKLLLVFIFALGLSVHASAVVSAEVFTLSTVEKFPAAQVAGAGPLPYNYRIIDGKVHAGGHPLNPATNFGNADKQALSILKGLKAKGVETVICLNGEKHILERYKKLLKKAGLDLLFVPMHASKVPTDKEWKAMKEAMKKPVYIHCKWGADRTGAVIAKYLVDVKGYPPKKAWQAVITGGSHAGPMGGMKKGISYQNMVLFFWPDALKDPEIKKYYQ